MSGGKLTLPICFMFFSLLFASSTPNLLCYHYHIWHPKNQLILPSLNIFRAFFGLLTSNSLTCKKIKPTSLIKFYAWGHGKNSAGYSITTPLKLSRKLFSTTRLKITLSHDTTLSKVTFLGLKTNRSTTYAMSKIHLEILDKSRLTTFNQLTEFPQGVLVGGTALALQICHRLSFDFDLFFPQPLKRKSLVRQCQNIFGEKTRFLIQNTDQVTLITPENIKLDLVYYPYKLITSQVTTPSVKLASIKDIAADKATTIGRRATWRDYVDIFFLLKRQILTLEEISRLAQKKFKGEFNEVLFWEQLVYFKDLEITKT